MMNKSVFLFFWLVVLYSCGTPKKAIEVEKVEDNIIVNTTNELALAGASNFESDENLNIKTAILKNVLAGKSGAFIGHKMDKLALYFKNKMQYTELLRVGEGLILELNNTQSFYFDTGKTSLNSTSKTTLDIIINSLKINPKINVIVEIHTDGKGSDVINLAMAEKRGKSIYEYFINQGIDKNRINVLALGEYFPKNENKTKADLENNRRIAFGFYASEALKSEAKTTTDK
jgi:outer membrane protein OmpA-like peptidoglycan-associated protein